MSPTRRRRTLAGVLLFGQLMAGSVMAQVPPSSAPADSFEAETRLDSVAEDMTGDEQPAASRPPLLGPDTADSPAELDPISLVMAGGWLMLPIAVMSVLVMMLVCERALALRRGKVIPQRLLNGLAELGAVPGVMDPRRAYRLCQLYPSSAAVVIRAMLLKLGRPHSEVEHAVAEVSEREAERLFGNVRWLNLIAAVAPLTGLLGTVWGMILAFYQTTLMMPGQNKAEALAEGIYVALVTTLGGLVVAIPAAICAHYFEGRVIKLFHEIDELLFSLLPQIERYEGQVRVTPHTLSGVDDPLGEGAADALRSAEPPRRGSAQVI